MEYVGIDPSTKTGVVIMENGIVKFEQEIILDNGMKSTQKEILDYGRKVVDLINQDSRIAVEYFALSAKGQAVSLLYGIGYAIRYALIDRELSFYEPTPSQLKKFVGTKGNAKKENMIKEVYKRWGYEHDSNNVIDAYALCRYAMSQEE